MNIMHSLKLILQVPRKQKTTAIITDNFHEAKHCKDLENMEDFYDDTDLFI